MTDFVDARYKTKEGLRWWPETELVRFVGKTYHPIPFHVTVENLWALDLGCGTGRHVWFLNECGFKAHGIDSSEEAIAIAKAYLSDRWMEPSSETFTKHVLPAIPFENEVLDLVIDCQTIQHLSADDHVKVYQEIARVLKPGGRFWAMHWMGGDAEHIYGGQYPELLENSRMDLPSMLQQAGLFVADWDLLTKTYAQGTYRAGWITIGAVKR